MTGQFSRRQLLGGALGLAATAAISACTSAVQQNKSAGSGPGESGGTLVIGSLTDIDPKTIYTQSITSMTIGLLVFDTLIRYDRQTLEPTPSVATGWEISPDGLTVRLTLRADVVFHSGRPFTSADVAYAISKYASEKAGSQLQATAAVVTAVDTADPHVAVLTLSHPLANLFDLLEFMLLTDKDTEEALALGEQFVGTGAFRFVRRQVGSEAEFARNETYWNGPARLDGVRLRVVRDAGALLTSVRARQSDLVLDASPQSLRPFSDESLYRIESEDVYDVAYYVGVNVARTELADKRVRQAISYAIDRDRLADEVFVGRGFASSAPWAKSSPAFSDAAAGRYSRDPDTARRLLSEARWSSGTRLLLSYGSGSAASKNIAAIIQNNLSEVGINAVLDPREQAAYNPFLKTGEHQLWISPHGFGQSNPATLATGAAPFKPKGNLSGFSSEAYTAVVDSFATIVDPVGEPAKAIYQQYTDILLDEQFVIDAVITTSTNVSVASVKDVSWNLYKDIDLHRTTVR